MKKQSLCLVLLIVFCLLCPTVAFADMGPKPSVHITLQHLPGGPCYGTLLSERRSTGPSTAWDGTKRGRSDYNYEPNPAVWEAFVAYEDPDGYYFLQESWQCDETGGFAWTYYPPQRFKILLYYPETDTFRTSGIYECYAFDSYFTVDASGQTLMAVRSYKYGPELFSLVCRAVLTVLVELAVAWVFRLRTKAVLLPILAVNAVTQIGLNVGLNLANYYSGPMAFVLLYIVAELGVVLVEALAYRCLLGKVQPPVSARRSTGYAVVANAVSFACGLVLAHWLPGIF